MQCVRNVEKPVDGSYRADLDLAVDSDRLVLDCVETQNSWREVCQRIVANDQPEKIKDAHRSGAG